VARAAAICPAGSRLDGFADVGLGAACKSTAERRADSEQFQVSVGRNGFCGGPAVADCEHAVVEIGFPGQQHAERKLTKRIRIEIGHG
jgi:hypothetical protein